MKAARSRKQDRNWRLRSHSVRESEERMGQLDNSAMLLYRNLKPQRFDWAKARLLCLEAKQRSLQKGVVKVLATQRLAPLLLVSHRFLKPVSILAGCCMISAIAPKQLRSSPRRYRRAAYFRARTTSLVAPSLEPGGLLSQ